MQSHDTSGQIVVLNAAEPRIFHHFFKLLLAKKSSKKKEIPAEQHLYECAQFDQADGGGFVLEPTVWPNLQLVNIQQGLRRTEPKWSVR